MNDNEDQSFLLAIDTKTGAEMSRTPRPEKSSWSTPYIWSNDKRTEIIVSGSSMVRSYDLDGKPLWQLGDMSGNAIPTPLAGEGLLYVCSGHVMGHKKPIMAVRPGATGDITLAPAETSNEFVAWCQRKAAPYNPSILLYKDLIYVVTDLGIFSCYDLLTGEPVYEKKRLPNGLRVYGVPLGVQRQHLLPERIRRHVRCQSWARVRDSSRQLSGPGHVPGHARGGRRQAANPQ